VNESVTATPAGDKILNYRVVSSPLKDHTGQVVAVIETVDDITERKRAEAQIQMLSHQLLKAQEEERQMISGELHDSVAQDLTIFKLSLGLFDKQPDLSAETRQKLAGLSKILDRSISNVRNLSYDLRPPELKEFGLLQALSVYCEDFTKNTDINVGFQAAGLKNVKMNSLIEINIYRLIQESLNNAKKHAGAKSVNIKLLGANHDIILRIEDDGKGFDMQAQENVLSSGKRLGIHTMKERVSLLQGHMTIQSCLGKGTKIFIKFPFREEHREGEEKTHHYY